MIIGEHRRQVVENIRKNVQARHFNAKAEVDDPVLTREQRIKLVNDFWAQSEKFSHKFTNLMTRAFFGAGTLILTANQKIGSAKKVKKVPNAVVTSNHFNQFDSLPIKRLAMKAHKRLYFVIEDTNLMLPSWIGFLMHNVDSIPITQSVRYLGREFPKHIANVFSKKNRWILIYPEQEMWFNYRKPRPLQKGAYYYAAKMNMPIISCFVELQDKNGLEPGHPDFHTTRKILHILPTIYPNERLSVDENARRMRDIDYQQKKQAYEKAYGKKLNYNFSYDDIAGYIPQEPK